MQLLRRPLLLEGEAGVGKTEVAKALASVHATELIRLQCYEGLDQSAALYEWNYQRQLLSIQAHRGDNPDAVEDQIFSEKYLLERPLLAAIRRVKPPVLLIDEIDRADDEFEAFLLEVLADNAVTIPEIGTIRAETPPLVVLTSNRTREVHDALKRRCLYHWVPHPSYEREVAILRRRLPEITARLAADVARATARLRSADLLKPPGVAESIDWAHALHLLGAEELDLERAAATLGAVLKYHEDSERVRDTVLAELIGA
jgi:MoxR-like ATPase